MRKVIMIAALLGLAGCATPEQRAAQVQADVERMIVTYGPGCEKLGYKPSDEKWRECVMRLSARDDQRYYHRHPMTTHCIGHRGFYHCSTF